MHYEVNYRIPVRRNIGRAPVNDWQDITYNEWTGDDVLECLAQYGTEHLVSVRLVPSGGWLH